ncbi:phosphatase PAP2 family protein [Microbacterium sp. Be9]|nr:phosphatase PAP2 family protein [Microbacterium sp. Be9]
MLRNTRLPHDASLTTPAPLLRHPWLPLVLGSAGILSTVSLGMLLVVAGRGPTALDGLWHDLMLDWRTEPWVAVATWFDSAGGVGAMVVVGLFLTVSLLIMRRPWSALALATAMICAEAATATIKVLVARPRPTDSLADTGLTSFPSGHTTIAATTAVMLTFLIGRRFWLVAVTWITMVAWSRTYLEAHWLTDVVAGAVLGTSIAVVVWWAVRRARSSTLVRRRSGAT